MKNTIRINHKLSEDRLTRHKELCAIEAAICACNPDFGIWESWFDGDVIVYSLKELDSFSVEAGND